MALGFKEGKGWFGDSRNGRDLQRQILDYLSKECGNSEFVGGDVAAIAEAQIYDCVEDTVPWSRIGAEADVDRIVFGEIRTLVYEKPNMVGMFQGELDLLVTVWDVEEDRSSSWHKTFIFPEDPERGEILPSFEINEREVRRKLYLLACEEVTVDFCGKLVPIWR